MTFRNPLHGHITFALALLALLLAPLLYVQPGLIVSAAKLAVASFPHVLLACVVGGLVASVVWAIERPDAAAALASECCENALASWDGPLALACMLGDWIADNTRSRLHPYPVASPVRSRRGRPLYATAPLPCVSYAAVRPLPPVTTIDDAVDAIYSDEVPTVEAIDLDVLWADRSIDDTSDFAAELAAELDASRAALESLDASIADLEALMRADDDGIGMALTGTVYMPIADATLALEGTQTADSPNVPSVDPIALDATTSEVATVAANKPIRKARGKGKAKDAAVRPLYVRQGNAYRAAGEGESGTHWYTGSAFYPVSVPVSYASK